MINLVKALASFLSLYSRDFSVDRFLVSASKEANRETRVVPKMSTIQDPTTSIPLGRIIGQASEYSAAEIAAIETAWADLTGTPVRIVPATNELMFAYKDIAVVAETGVELLAEVAHEAIEAVTAAETDEA